MFLSPETQKVSSLLPPLLPTEIILLAESLNAGLPQPQRRRRNLPLSQYSAVILI